MGTALTRSTAQDDDESTVGYLGNIGTFYPSANESKKKGPSHVFNLKSTGRNSVGFEVKKPSREDLSSLDTNDFERALIDSLLKKDFAPEQIIRILEIFQEHEAERQEHLKEKLGLTTEEAERVLASIPDAPSAPVLLNPVLGKRKSLPTQTEIHDQLRKEAELKKIKIEDIRSGKASRVIKEAANEEVVVPLNKKKSRPSAATQVVESTPTQKSSQEKMKVIQLAFDGIQKSRGNDMYRWGGPLARDVKKERVQEKNTIDTVPTWRKSPLLLAEEGLTTFLYTLETTGNEDIFFSRYAPLYTAGNPSAVDALKGFNAYNVLNVESFAELNTAEKRNEVSAIIKHLETILLLIDTSFVLPKDVSIHELYLYTKDMITRADKEYSNKA
jgi:hypothetical protein